MTTVGDIYALLCGFAPLETKMEGDNPGLLVGRPDAAVTKVLVALDVTPETILEAETFGAELMVTHHPVIYRPMRAAVAGDVTGERVLMLAERGIAAICMHTNLDRAEGGVGTALCMALGLESDGGYPAIPGGDGFVRLGHLPEAMVLDAFAADVRRRLHANGVRYADAGRPVKVVAAGGGSCGDYAGAALAAGADTLVTGEASYHDMRDALLLGVNLIAAGHFPTEDPVCGVLTGLLRERFPALDVKKSEALGDAWQVIGGTV